MAMDLTKDEDAEEVQWELAELTVCLAGWLVTWQRELTQLFAGSFDARALSIPMIWKNGEDDRVKRCK